ncbi:MAG: XTP/dITP diphosphatase [Gemella sp.]|nr:XTP/dITP diphosphatase [Gemella sp.]
MKELVLASNNKHKIKEIQNILTEYMILSLHDIGFKEEIEETGITFEENSLIKARRVAEFSGKMTIADDSGLCVERLNNEPGVYSARYSQSGDDEDNLQKVLEKLQGEESLAKYVCVISLIDKNKNEYTFTGECHGKIITKKQGNNGFGYDPIFFVESLNKTFAEVSSEEKNKISHRKKALDKLCDYLTQI